ncbi:hypothetical protein [Microbacterium sp. 77mftsu3.1]|uniref:hypothetical protein n=1 Tax=Microbacterium sp. 77mftsu3.1 TaxID=1761802 RepID=UPI00115FD5EB|nr:hypothetical protein [Microbacterium sp. 77mftsu3.1]
MTERMKNRTLAQAIADVERQHQTTYAPDTIDQGNHPAFIAGARAGMEWIVSAMFSEEGLQRAVDAYEARADLPPLDRMEWAMAAALNATDYIIE